MNIGYLKEKMSEQNINIAKLATKAEVGQSTISEILNGVRKDVRLATAKRIAVALNIDINDLCKEE